MSSLLFRTRLDTLVVLTYTPSAYAYVELVNHANVAVPRAMIATRSIATEEIRALFFVNRCVFIEISS